MQALVLALITPAALALGVLRLQLWGGPALPRAPGIARAGLVRAGGVHLPCFHYARHGCRQWNAQASVEAQVAVPPPRAFGVNSLPPPCHRLARVMDAKRLCPKALEEWDRATESTRLPSKAGDALVDDDQVSEGSLCGRTQIVTESAATSKSNSKRGPKRKAKNEARMLAFIQQKGGSSSSRRPPRSGRTTWRPRLLRLGAQARAALTARNTSWRSPT